MAETTHVVVAANFADTMRQLVSQFERTTAHSVTVSVSSSGKAYAQIINGAPYHLFFSADQRRPAALAERGLIVPGSQFTYASGQLVLWSRDPTFIQTTTANGPVRLSQGSFDRLALANPKVAPYGSAATQVLANLGLLQATRAKWVQGENIAQAFQFVDSGNAEWGFVSLSQLLNRPGGSAWRVPSALHEPIRQDVVLLTTGADNVAARALLDFVRSQPARAIIQSRGYRLPAQAGKPLGRIGVSTGVATGDPS